VRVLAVGNLYPPHHLGGYELIWHASVAHLRAGGHEVRVLTGDHREPGAEGEEDGDVHRELRLYWRDHAWPRVPPLARLRLERHNARVLDRHLAQTMPDAVAWWGLGGMSLSLVERVHAAGIPAVGVVCDEWLLYGPEVDQWTAGISARPRVGPLAARLTGLPGLRDPGAAAKWIFLSEHLRQRALARWTLPRTEVAHTGPDPDTFRPAKPRTWGWRLAYVGRIDRRKGIDLAVRALARLPAEATLRIAGGGDAEHASELRRLAGELGVWERVEFGRASRAELQEIYAACDAVVFPVTWNEPWGLVPLEAMTVGRPVVATGRGGSGEYLRDGENSLLFDPDAGEEALARALTRLAGDEALRERLRRGGRATVAGIEPRGFDEAVERALLDAAARG
jgi:glycogen(starch) synthase